MLIIELKHRLADLTPAVCQAFEAYQCSEVLKQIIASRQTLGVEYQAALENHFNAVASDAYVCRFDNPACTGFMAESRHLKYLVWLLFTVHNPHLLQEEADELYARNKELIDVYVIGQFKQQLSQLVETDQVNRDAQELAGVLNPADSNSPAEAFQV